ncbi:MAG: CoA transferase [Acidobacteriota bacterium]
MSEAKLPLEGVRVVEVATWIAAPVAATILGDLGADVIKVEPPGEGDPYRALTSGPGFEPCDVNYTWMMDARGKRSVALDLKNERCREALLRLVEACDVFITNQPHPIRQKFGLRYEDLAPRNERMIYASLTAFGEKGPERDRPGFDQVAYWARSGLLDLVRAPGAPPVQGLPGMGDHPTGVALYAAILTALFRRERTGKGGHVQTSLLANGFWSNGCLGQGGLAGLGYDARREAPVEPGPMSSLHTLYECSCGGTLQLNMVRTEAEIEALYGVLGLGELLEDPRFAADEGRFENGAVLVERFRALFARAPLAEWLERLEAAGVPASHMARVEDLARDEQAIVNGVLLDGRAAGVGMDWIINHPVGVDGLTRGATKAPELDEHGEEVLCELGYSPEEIAEIRSGS